MIPRAALALGALAGAAAFGAAPEPWPPLNGGSFSGRAQPASPDPLVRYVWPLPAVDDRVLQIIELAPAAVGAGPATAAGSFANASAAAGAVACAIRVTGGGTLVVDFGVEFAGWFEFDSPDIAPADARALTLGIGEYDAVDYVGGFKQGAPAAYNGTFRLETSPVGPELYEGVRFAFMTLPAAPSRPFTITALRGVAQAKPVNYVGSFSSAGDPVLEAVWYAAAYTVRATLQADYMGSILMNRGDRFSWTGDAHPTQAASMAAFGNYAFVYNNLNRTKADCQGIATYCLYFVLSVNDYWRATGDAAGVRALAPAVATHLDEAAARWADPQGLRFVGWDDRTGSGFANNTTPETQALYRLLAIRAWAAAAAFLGATGDAAAAAKYAALAANRTAAMRAAGGAPWYGALGLHASADAVNAGFLTPAEAAGVAAGALGDAVKLPSQSNFNQYFILQALGGLGQLDRAVESVRAVWGAVLDAGATTFWETSHPSVATIMPPGPAPPAAEQSGWVSLCHPWAAGPTPWLTAWVAGIRPLEPGFRRVLLAPHVAHSMHGVAGAAATPHGAVSLNASRGGALRVELPAGVAAATLQLSAVTLARLLGVAAVDAADVDLVDAASGAVLASRVAAPADAPLLDEANAPRGRARALVAELAGGRAHALRVALRRAAGAPPPPPLPPWAPRGSPFPPPAWPGRFVGADYATRGDWRGVYGADGYVLLGFDAPRAAGNPFCGASGEGSTLSLRCVDAGATIDAVSFGAYGDAAVGACPNLRAGACDAPNATAVLAAACVGKAACHVDINNSAFGGDPCPGTPKVASVVAHCTGAGGGLQPGADAPPADRAALPGYVTSVTAQTPAVSGLCAARGSWSNGTDDVRALADPAGGAARHLGFVQPCGCPTAPVDILLSDAAKAAGRKYRLSLYFVDFAPSATCGGLDGTARTQEVYLLTGYPDLSPATPRQYLANFSGGVWMSYDVAGDIRVRISTIRGDMAVLSALAFDAAA
jgi:alpha-L-rhamnosidase